MWTLDRQDLIDVAAGAALLGSGGGGDPFWFRAMVDHAMVHDIEVWEAQDLPHDACVVHVGLVGSLTTFEEKPSSGAEFSAAVTRLAREFADGRTIFVANYETAGANAFAGLLVAADTDLPFVDVDAMGRGLSWLDQTTYDAAEVSICPFVLTDSHGQILLLDGLAGAAAERHIRASAVLMGGWCAFAGYPVTSDQVAAAGVIGTLARARALGRDVGADTRIVTSHRLVTEHGAVVMGAGRVTQVEWRRLRDGGVASIVVRGSGPDPAVLRVEARNEFLMVICNGKVVARSPDIICLVRARDGRPLSAERIAVGNEVDIVVLPAPGRWNEKEFENKVHPREFGLAHADG